MWSMQFSILFKSQASEYSFHYKRSLVWGLWESIPFKIQPKKTHEVARKEHLRSLINSVQDLIPMMAFAAWMNNFAPWKFSHVI